MAVEVPRLVVLSRDGCHLCDEMMDALRALQPRQPFTLEAKDIDEDPELVRRYGARIPVLLAGDVELSQGRLDAARVNAWLAKFG